MPLAGGRGPRFGTDAKVGRGEAFVDRQKTQQSGILKQDVPWFSTSGNNLYSSVSETAYAVNNLYLFPIPQQTGSMYVTRFYSVCGSTAAPLGGFTYSFALYEYLDIRAKYSIVGNFNATVNLAVGDKDIVSTFSCPPIQLQFDETNLFIGITSSSSSGYIVSTMHDTGRFAAPQLSMAVTSTVMPQSILSSALTANIGTSLPIPSMLFLSDLGKRMFGVT